MSTAAYPEAPILLVDDEEQALKSYDLTLRYNGYTNTIRCQDSRRVQDILAERQVSLVMLDLCMPHVTGEELLEYIGGAYPDIPVIVVTGYNEVDRAVRCMRAGSMEYLVKPVERERLLPAVESAVALWKHNAAMKAALAEVAVSDDGEAGADEDVQDHGRGGECFPGIISGNVGMRALFRYIKAIAVTSEPVLVTGETGVGKEAVARAIHATSGRAGRFVAVNAAGLDDAMFADTLFGHRKGAFTGADTNREGLVETAAGGSLFLDEIGDLSLNSQLKLLRLLQEKEYYPVGADACKRMDARIIVATNQSLDALLDPARFRRDLFYRLRTHLIAIPPLRDRLDDLPLLLAHFAQKAAKTLGRKSPSLPRDLSLLLATHAFPGNVRELETMVFDAVARHDSGRLPLASFKAWIDSTEHLGQRRGEHPGAARLSPPDQPEPHASTRVLPTLKQAENTLIEDALRMAEGNQSVAARVLGITRQALNRRLLYKRKKTGFS